MTTPIIDCRAKCRFHEARILAHAAVNQGTETWTIEALACDAHKAALGAWNRAAKADAAYAAKAVEHAQGMSARAKAATAAAAAWWTARGETPRMDANLEAAKAEAAEIWRA